MTDAQKWLSRKYLIYQFTSNLWFMGAVWLYFYRLFITDQQVGTLDALAFGIGLIAEIPSGALADKFGRDRIVRLGLALTGGGFLLQAFSSGYWGFAAGQAIVMIGMSFVSGADDALFFEELKFDRTSRAWRKLVTRASQVALVASLSAYLIGGWVHTINPRIPWALVALGFFISVVIIWPIRDKRPRAARQGFSAELRDYLHDILTGFQQFGGSKLWPYVPLIMTVQGLFYTAGYGLLRIVLLSRFHFSPMLGACAIALSWLITVGILSLMHKYAEHMREKQFLTLISLAAAASLLLAVGNIGYRGYIVILVLYAGERMIYPFMSEALNNHAPERQRATVLSVASFLRSVPYVGLAPLIGGLNTHGKLQYFLIGWAIVICVAVILYVVFERRNTQVHLHKAIET